MKIAFGLLLVVHGALHLLGFVKAFGLAEVERLTVPVGKPAGVLWLVAALAYLVAAALWILAPERWYLAALPAFVMSQMAIATSWQDAKFGTLPNVVVLLPLALALADLRSSSFRSEYDARVAKALARARTSEVVTEADLARLPADVATYLRRAGVVGKPRVRDLRVRFGGRMKNGKDGGWMSVRVEQVEVFDPPERLFLVSASKAGVPFQALHVYEDATATMRVRVLSLFEIVDARGPEMNTSETVTLFNDLCLLAPATLVDAPIVWEVLGPRRVRGTYTNGPNKVSAELTFDEAGDLAGFVSNDRLQSADGKTFLAFPWSTPVRDYVDFAPARLASKGDAIWKEPSGDFPYAEFTLEAIEYNTSVPRGATRGDR